VIFAATVPPSSSPSSTAAGRHPAQTSALLATQAKSQTDISGSPAAQRQPPRRRRRHGQIQRGKGAGGNNLKTVSGGFAAASSK
jgi:hypothetical protein